jgi:hypothetical protein
MLHNSKTNTQEPSMEGNTLRSVRSRQTYAAMAGMHGPRLATYATQINPLDIVTVLGHDPRSEKRRFLTDQKIVELYEYMQRKTSNARRDAIKNYIEDRLFPQSDLVGGFPAISIAVQYPISSEEINPAFPGVVNMSIDTGIQNKRVALDGLGRISGALALVDLALSDELNEAESDELQKALQEIAIPCVFYSPRPGQSPLTPEEMGQLFHDFNFKVTPVSAKDAIALDQSDPYIRATYYLARYASYIAKFGMDTRSASLGSKSKAIVVQPVLLRFVRAALEGAKYVEAARNVSIENPHLTAKNAPQVLGSLAEFLDTFAEAMGHNWYHRESVHLSSGGWQALGIIYHDITFRLKGIDRNAFAVALAKKVDWSRDAEIWKGIMTHKEDKAGNPVTVLLGAGASTRRQIVQRLRDAMGLTERLSELKDDEE